jgi:hypothetical protein
LGSQDPVLCGQIFVPQEKFLIYGSGDVSQHASPNHSRASLNLIVEPGLYMLLRFQKAAVGRNYETGNQAFSKRLRFLTTRVQELMRHANCRCTLEIYSQARLQAKREAQHRLVELIIPREREAIETELSLIPSKSEAARMKLA